MSQVASEKKSRSKRVARDQQVQQAVREAVGGQLNRVTVIGFLFLVAGIVVGYGIATRQSRLVVDQFQREVRGLSDDILALEVAAGQQTERQLASLETRHQAEVSRLHREHRASVEATLRRTEMLEQQVQRQIELCQSTERNCLAELHPYEQRKLAIPVDEVTQAVDRLLLTQVESFQRLLDSVRTQTIEYQSQMAELPVEAPGLACTAASLPDPSIDFDLFSLPGINEEQEGEITPGSPITAASRTITSPQVFNRSASRLNEGISTIRTIEPPCSPGSSPEELALNHGPLVPTPLPVDGTLDPSSLPMNDAAPFNLNSEEVGSTELALSTHQIDSSPASTVGSGLAGVDAATETASCPETPMAQQLAPIPDGPLPIPSARQGHRFFATPAAPRAIFFASGRTRPSESSPTRVSGLKPTSTPVALEPQDASTPVATRPQTPLAD
ncbi:MAG: hypothetical protein R3C01_08220 [Planctomycetaceae bacterium]